MDRSVQETTESLRRWDVEWCRLISHRDAVDVFDVYTSIDAYVARKTRTLGLLTEFENSDSKWKADAKAPAILPNFDCPDLRAVLAGPGERRVEVVTGDNSSRCVEEPDDLRRFKWAVKVPRFKPPVFGWDWEAGNGYGKPKAVFCNWNTPGTPFADSTGEISLGDCISGVVCESSEAESLAAAMDSERFRRIMKAVRVASSGYNIHAIRTFKDRFWHVLDWAE